MLKKITAVLGTLMQVLIQIATLRLTFKRILITMLIIGLIAVGFIGRDMINKSLALKATKDFCGKLGIKIEGKPRLIESSPQYRHTDDYEPPTFLIHYLGMSFDVDALTHEVIGFKGGNDLFQEDDPLRRLGVSQTMSREEKIKLAEGVLHTIGKPKEAVFDEFEEDKNFLIFKWKRVLNGYEYKDNMISLTIKKTGKDTIVYRYLRKFEAKSCLSTKVKITKEKAIDLAMRRINRIANLGVYDELNFYKGYIIEESNKLNFYRGYFFDEPVGEARRVSLGIIQPNNFWTPWRIKIAELLPRIFEIQRPLNGIAGRRMGRDSRLAWIVDVKLIKLNNGEKIEYYHSSPAMVYVDAANGKILGGSL